VNWKLGVIFVVVLVVILFVVRGRSKPGQGGA
jgi:hypothetical protein